MTEEFVLHDTIAALASAPGAAPRGIVRVSGPDVRGILQSVFTPEDPRRWEAATRAGRHPGRASLPGVTLPLPVDVLLWPTRRSFTGEPLAEFHTIGCPPLLEALLQGLFAGGARPARRGEFTLRAFLAGRIDLLQAEAVLGVIEATDQQQLQRALTQLGGGLSHRLTEIHEQLLLHLADLEAGLDFVEEDIEFVTRGELIQRIADVRQFLAGLRVQSMERLPSTARQKVVLAGLPNAGKSTLFNAFAGRDAALVSEQAGTTRDYLSRPLDWEGLLIELIDTAGWEEGAAGITQSASEHRQQQWAQADLLVWCASAASSERRLLQDQQQWLQTASLRIPRLRVMTKADLGGCSAEDADVLVSAVTGEGLCELARSHSTATADGPIRP